MPTQTGKIYQHARKADPLGLPRYSVFGIELAEPHDYQGDIFDAARMRRIYQRTQTRRPLGTLFVGHNGPEQYLVGRCRYHWTVANRVLCDYVKLEPPTMLDIALGRLPGRSLEFEYPSFEIIEGVALLGSSRQFFPFPDVCVRLTPDEMDQLRRDVAAWPHRSRSTPQTTHRRSWRRYAGAAAMPDKKKFFRQKMTSGGLTIEIAEGDSRPADDASNWRALREGESAPMAGGSGSTEEQISELRSIIDDRFNEIAARVQVLEDSKQGAEGEDNDGADESGDASGDAAAGGADAAEGATANRADDEQPIRKKSTGSAGAKRVNAGNDELARLRKRLDARETAEAGTAIHSQIDAAVAGGKVVDAEQRELIVAAALRKAPAERRKAVEALLKNNRTASLRDAEGGNDADTNAAVAGLADGEAKEFRALLGRLTPEGAKRARDLSKLYDEFVSEGSPVAKLSRSKYVAGTLDEGHFRAKAAHR